MSYFSLFHCFDSTSQVKRLCWALASTKWNFHLPGGTPWLGFPSKAVCLQALPLTRQTAQTSFYSVPKVYIFTNEKLPWQDTMSVVFKPFPKISKSLSNIRLIQMPSHIKDVATGSRLHMRPFRPLGMQVWQHLFSQPPFPTFIFTTTSFSTFSLLFQHSFLQPPPFLHFPLLSTLSFLIAGVGGEKLRALDLTGF